MFVEVYLGEYSFWWHDC